VGAVLIAGTDYEMEYVLVNDEYHFVKTGAAAWGREISEAAEAKPISFEIWYSDSGYIKKVVKYTKLDVPSAELFVGNHTTKEIVCRADEASGVIEPTFVETGEDLGPK
jgi:predicted alternative tryptophan synthase beta-subunit